MRIQTQPLARHPRSHRPVKSAETMPESKYRYWPTKDIRSFAEILNHVADISYTMCSNVKDEANPSSPTATVSKAEIIAYLKCS
jgi:hypothetical protein